MTDNKIYDLRSWRIVSDFNQLNHLFSASNILADYIVETFICTCSHKEFIVRDSSQELHYHCKKCGNDKFDSTDDFWNNSAKRAYSDLPFDISTPHHIEITQQHITASYGVHVPSSIEFSKPRVVYDYQPLLYVRLNRDGTIEKSNMREFEYTRSKLQNELEERLLAHISHNDVWGIPHNKGAILSLDEIKFFLEHPHLKEYDFIRWQSYYLLPPKIDFTIEDALMYLSYNPSAKSVKKAIYKVYDKELSMLNKFSSAHLYTLTSIFQDVNYLKKTLNHYHYYNDFSDEIENCILFSLMRLLQNYYTEEELCYFYISLTDDIQIFDNLLSEYRYYFSESDNGDGNFQRVPCTVDKIHDELVRCNAEFTSTFLGGSTISKE